MKQYIKSLTLLLMICMGLVACNDNGDFDDFEVDYPTSVPLGYYQSEYTASGDYEYAVLLTKSVDNDTIMQVFMRGKTGGEKENVFRTIMTTTNLAYDASLGMLSGYSTDSYFGKEATAVIAYAKDKQHLILEITYGSKSVSTSLVSATLNNLPVFGNWTSEGLLMSFTDEAVGDGSFKGVMSIVTEQGNNEIPFTYIFDGVNGTFTESQVEGDSETPIQGTFRYGDDYSLNVKVDNNKAATLYRTFSTPEPEIYVPVYYGVYAHSVKFIGTEAEQVNEFFKGQLYEAVLLRGQRDRDSYCIRPFLNNPDGLYFSMNPKDNTLATEVTMTGYGLTDGTPIIAYSIPEVSGVEETSSFNGKKTYTFIMQYAIPGVPVYKAVEQFVIRGQVE